MLASYPRVSRPGHIPHAMMLASLSDGQTQTAAHSRFQVFQWVEKGLSRLSVLCAPTWSLRTPLLEAPPHSTPLFCLLIMQPKGVVPQLSTQTGAFLPTPWLSHIITFLGELAPILYNGPHTRIPLSSQRHSEQCVPPTGPWGWGWGVSLMYRDCKVSPSGVWIWRRNGIKEEGKEWKKEWNPPPAPRPPKRQIGDHNTVMLALSHKPLSHKEWLWWVDQMPFDSESVPGPVPAWFRALKCFSPSPCGVQGAATLECWAVRLQFVSP